jgi:hypothetical protein
MDPQRLKHVAAAAQQIQQAVNKKAPLPSEPTAPTDQPVIPHSLFTTAPAYLQKIAFQVNACYLATAYDGCAVMARKLIESLIIDCYEKHKIPHKIQKNTAGDYHFLKDLVAIIKAETAWATALGRNTSKYLDQLKDVGDLSAHTKWYNAKRDYIDDLKTPLRVTAERLLYLAGHK